MLSSHITMLSPSAHCVYLTMWWWFQGITNTNDILSSNYNHKFLNYPKIISVNRWWFEFGWCIFGGWFYASAPLYIIRAEIQCIVPMRRVINTSRFRLPFHFNGQQSTNFCGYCCYCCRYYLCRYIKDNKNKTHSKCWK